jgi:hypothetical protein
MLRSPHFLENQLTDGSNHVSFMSQMDFFKPHHLLLQEKQKWSVSVSISFKLKVYLKEVITFLDSDHSLN